MKNIELLEVDEETLTEHMKNLTGDEAIDFTRDYTNALLQKEAYDNRGSKESKRVGKVRSLPPVSGIKGRM